jgi:LuxR family maltose regulon positive regulatory protein
LQLAASAVEHAPDVPAAIRALSAREGSLERYFLESLLEGLPTDLTEFLERISILEFMVPELCEAVTGCTAAADKLRQLARDTPILIVGERRGWSRLHPLARDFLLGRFDRLPEQERRELHRRAMRWFCVESQYPEAARHALAAGEHALADRYAQRSLWDLVKEGRLTEAREWLARLPDQDMNTDAVFRISAAWVMALGARPTEGRRMAEEIGRLPGVNTEIRFEAAVVRAVGATFCDRPDDLRRALAEAPPPTALRDPIVGIAHANHSGLLALFEGDTTRVRQLLRGTLASGFGTPEHAISYSYCLDGVAHLWDGDTIKADAAVRPALELVERETGRRSVMAAALATVLAAALYERDRPGLAQGLLANRLDVIERAGVPEVILLAYRTLAYVALSQGDERRALDVLGGLFAIGVARHWPRATLTSLAEQIRIHALRSRAETIREKIAALDALGPMFAEDGYVLFEPHYLLQSGIAKAYAALAQFDLDAAGRHLAIAGELAARLHRRRDALIVKALRGIVAHERGDAGAHALLLETAELAALGGLDRLLADAHPLAPGLVGLADRRRQGGDAEDVRPNRAAPADASRLDAAAFRRPVALAGGVLTPKEAEVLRLLDVGLPNKQIAKTMNIGDETVKWHLKNLFSKLNAGSRRHAVDRARLMGLLAP